MALREQEKQLGVWRWLAGLFGLFVLAIIVSADLGLSFLHWVAYLPGQDFSGHVVLIGALGFLVNGALGARRAGRRGPLLGTWIVGILVLVEEISQIWLPSRAFSLSDLAADALGLALADLAWRAVRWRSGAPDGEPLWADDQTRG